MSNGEANWGLIDAVGATLSGHASSDLPQPGVEEIQGRLLGLISSTPTNGFEFALEELMDEDGLTPEGCPISDALRVLNSFQELVHRTVDALPSGGL